MGMIDEEILFLFCPYPACATAELASFFSGRRDAMSRQMVVEIAFETDLNFLYQHNTSGRNGEGTVSSTSPLSHQLPKRNAHRRG